MEPYLESPTSVVLVPCFNGERFLSASIDSLLHQSIPPTRICLIDDGSDDGSRAIILGYARTHPHIEAICFDKNRGKAVVLNEAIDSVTEKYIFIQDADDLASPLRVEKQLAFMEKNPAIGCSSSNVRYINEKNSRIGKGQLDLTSRETLAKYLTSRDPFGLFCPAAVIRSSVFQNKSLRFRGEFWPADDIDLWNRIAESGWQVLAQPEYLVDYRVHTTSAVTSSFVKTREKFEYVRACLRARRGGNNEPDWKTFQAQRQARRWPTKLNDWRKTMAKGLYRSAGFRWGANKRVKAVMDLVSAALLQPFYVLPRLWKQRS